MLDAVGLTELGLMVGLQANIHGRRGHLGTEWWLLRLPGYLHVLLVLFHLMTSINIGTR